MTTKPFDFVAESMVTASNTFHGEKVGITELLNALQDFSAAAERLDKMKKALFYGRDYIANSSRPQPSRPAEDEMSFSIIERVAEQLEADENSVTGKDAAELRSLLELVFHGIVGVATESGEMVDAWLDAYKHGKTLDAINLREEFGDNQWYVAIAINAIGRLTLGNPLSFESLHRIVNAKLRHRFADGFSEFDANNRDLVGERAILEGDEYTFSAEEVSASGEMQGKPVEPPFGCSPVREFPDEPMTGVDPVPGKFSS